MALLRIGGLNSGRKREEILSGYEGEEPYMPGGYETPYDGEEPYMPNGYDSSDDDYDDGYDGDYGYDDRYEDGSRYDDDYGYDDAYGDDGDYDGDYDADRGPYYEGPRYEGDREYEEDGDTDLARYMYEHDWPTWVLLFLLPPVGIWLLWRRQRYSQGANIVLSVLSTLWMAAFLYTVIAKPFKRPSETTITPQPVGAAAVAALQEASEEAPEAATVENTVIPAEEVDEANAVYTVTGTPYYHQGQGCAAIPVDAEVNRVSRASAIEGSLMACPYCMAGQYSDGLWDLKIVNADTEDKSNMTVYCSPFNTHFHTNATCSDIGGDAHEVSLKDALLMAKTACEVCCPQAAMQFYCTLQGTYYHAKDECSGMRDASYVTYAEARVTGKKRCPVCIGGSDETETNAGEATGYYVYATDGGTYYHVNSTCSGMKNAKQVLLSDMLKQNRPACPVCCPDAEATVYAETGNPYFHSYATCSGMTHATQGILVNALAAGLTRCPVCWKES